MTATLLRRPGLGRLRTDRAPLHRICLAFVVLVVLAALLAPWIAPRTRTSSTWATPSPAPPGSTCSASTPPDATPWPGCSPEPAPPCSDRSAWSPSPPWPASPSASPPPGAAAGWTPSSPGAPSWSSPSPACCWPS
ncbi:hypothetical protein ACFQ0M_40455 [Kitasatospora aburaviensis]